MPAYRTPVRYKGSRGVCVRIVDIPMRGDCAPILRVIFSHGGKGRELLWGLSCGRLIYTHRFVLLSAIPFRCSIFRLALRLALASRFASRCGVLPCVSFMRLALRLVLRPAHHLALRLVRAFRFSCRLAYRSSCVPPCVPLFCLLVDDAFHEAPFRLACRLPCHA